MKSHLTQRFALPMTLLLLFFFWIKIPSAIADDKVHMKTESSSDSIADLTWDGQDFDIEVSAPPEGSSDPRVTAKLHGKYDGEASLIRDNKRVEIADEKFSCEIEITGPETPAEIQSVTQLGEVKKQRFTLELTNFEQIIEDYRAIHGGAPVKRFSAIPSLGMSTVSYSQPGVGSFSELGVSAKVELHYILKPQLWDSKVYAFGLLLPFSPTISQSSLAATGLSYFGAGGEVGYTIRSIRAPWTLTIYGGVSYLTTFTSESFGFQNVLGLQLYPSVRRALGNGGALKAYAKYVPLSSAFSPFTLDNGEIGFGVGYDFPSKKPGKHWGVQFDGSLLNLGTTLGIVNSNVFTLSGSLSI